MAGGAKERQLHAFWAVIDAAVTIAHVSRLNGRYIGQ